MKSDKKHLLLIDEIKMRSKKKCEAENRKTQTLLQATITRSIPCDRETSTEQLDGVSVTTCVLITVVVIVDAWTVV